VSSEFARAVTTAEHVRRATGAPLSFEPPLREWNLGVGRGHVGELGVPTRRVHHAGLR